MSDQQPLALPAGASTAQQGTMLTLPAVAERLGVSLSTVRRLLKSGQLEGAELQPSPAGPTWCVPLATVESRLAAGKKQTTAAPLRIQASKPAEQVTAELVALRQQVQDLTVQLRVSEAVAHERGQELERLHDEVVLD